MVFDKKKDNKVIKNLSPSSEKCNKKVDLINMGKEGVDNNGDSIRTVLSDQEYIVFSFREDGSFDVDTDSIAAKSESSSVDGKRENSKAVSRKVHITHSLPLTKFSIFHINYTPMTWLDIIHTIDVIILCHRFLIDCEYLYCCQMRRKHGQCGQNCGCYVVVDTLKKFMLMP